MSSTLPAPKIREPIPGYLVKERIGAGGYGEVWSAQAPGGLTKAIKFVYGYFDDDRAARELKALNRIKEVRHPFLLSLERIEIVDGQLVIVTELADMSLKDRYRAVPRDGRPRHSPRGTAGLPARRGRRAGLHERELHAPAPRHQAGKPAARRRPRQGRRLRPGQGRRTTPRPR